MTRPVLIVGTGALATLFAARLSAAGASVSMLGTWRNGLDALRENGARLVEADGTMRTHPVTVTDDPINSSNLVEIFLFRQNDLTALGLKRGEAVRLTVGAV